MKSHYTISKLSFSIFSLFMVILLTSCGSTQNITSSEDGIYTDNNQESRVVYTNERDYNNYNNNYFSKELQRLEDIKNGDIITDIDNYNSYNEADPIEEVIIDENTPRTQINYNNEPWGYSNDADVVVNINTYGGFHNPYWGGYWNTGFYGWGWNRWNRWNRWNYWGYAPYWHPYHNGWNTGFYIGLGGYWGNPYYCPPNYYYGNNWRNRGFYRGRNPYRTRYGSVYANRGYARNSIANSNRRSTNYRNNRNVRSTRRSPSNSGRTRNYSRRTIRNYNSNGRIRGSRNIRSTSPNRRSIRSIRSSRNSRANNQYNTRSNKPTRIVSNTRTNRQ